MTRTMETENFPVGSWLIAKPLRPVVFAYYKFARAADDIGDDPHLPADEKIRRLDALDQVLAGREAGNEEEGLAATIRDRLAPIGVPVVHCRDLLAAFKQDATKLRYTDYADLMGYCRHSASPVGRFLLDLHGESKDLWQANDALCNALQVLNHVQDCKDDLLALDRCYLPQDAFVRHGAEIAELRAEKSSPALRRVLDETLENTRPLVKLAITFSDGIRSGGLKREAAVIAAIAERLLEKLLRLDPVGQRVELSKGEFVMAGLTGLGRSLFPGGR